MSTAEDRVADHPPKPTAEEVLAAETGARSPQSRVAAGVITALCLAWTLFQIWIAYVPINQMYARSWHLAFALGLVFLTFPTYGKTQMPFLGRWIFGSSGMPDPVRGRRQVLWIQAAIVLVTLALAAYLVRFYAFGPGGNGMDFSHVWIGIITIVILLLLVWLRAVAKTFVVGEPERGQIPIPDIALAVISAGSALYIFFDYDGIITRQGLPSELDVWLGVVMVLLLLEAARRALGPALTILGAVFLAYCFLGPHLPDLLRHRGIPLDFVVNDMYLSDTGVFGVPLGVSVGFVFLFVLFGAFLDKAGAGKYFIDVAFAGLGGFSGGPAKAAVVASGLTGLVSGSSISNTVTTGTFTIPLMKRVGLPAYKAAAVEVAASTNGQLMPPVMGAAAFIMADFLGIPYLDVVRAALIPALVSYLALIYVVHLEARKLGLRALGRDELPNLGGTFIRGVHYLLPLFVLMWFLVVERKSALYSAVQATQTIAVIMLLQRPIIAYVAYHLHMQNGCLAPTDTLAGVLRTAFVQGLRDFWDALIAGARNMITVGVATATAGIIVGVVTITGLVGRFTDLIGTLSGGSVYVMLVLTALTSMILGMGLPTTANYILMASLTAPVIAQLGADAGLVFPLLAAHLFVFYFGILADDTPPVGLAAYAGAAIARSDPIRTGIQGFTYDLRTAILPFVFLFNTELLMISEVTEQGEIVWIDDLVRLGWVFAVALLAMFAFAASLQGYFADRCNLIERLLLLGLCLVMLRPDLVTGMLSASREIAQAGALALLIGLYLLQRLRSRRRGDQEPVATGD